MKSLSQDDREYIFQLASALVSTCQDESHRLSILVENVEKRMRMTNTETIDDYLLLASSDKKEFDHLISSLTIHHTSWFREESHFEMIYSWVEQGQFDAIKPLRIASIGCSTGEEVYSVAMMFEKARLKGQIHDFYLDGFDIDPKSIETATRAVYPMSRVPSIPKDYRSFLRQGSGKSSEFFTLLPEIRSRCNFKQLNLVTGELPKDRYQIILCRNILIYFSDETVRQLVRKMKGSLTPNGYLILGHSESLAQIEEGWLALSHATYQATSAATSNPAIESPPIKSIEAIEVKDSKMRPRALVIDDSALIRSKLESLLASNGFDVTTAASAAQGSRALRETNFDVITLDVEMPGEDGPSWLVKQRNAGLRIPVIMITSLNVGQVPGVLGALERGAQDFVEKKILSSDPQLVVEKVSALLKLKPTNSQTIKCPRLASAPPFSPELILIGASTGGPQALHEVLQNLPKPCPPIVVVQHITKDFAALFADRLAMTAGLKLHVVTKRLELEQNAIYLGNGDKHLVIGEDNPKNGTHRGSRFWVELRPATSEDLHVPSVESLFHSAAALPHCKSIWACLFTGMGKDGAQGLLRLKQNGATTVVQDEDSCVVFGMPREALHLGAACYQGNLQDIRRFMLTMLGKTPLAGAV